MMVSIREAEEQLQVARGELLQTRTQLGERQTQISSAEGRIRELRFPGTLSTQLALASQKGIGVGGAGAELKRRRRVLRREKTTAFGQIRAAREELQPIISAIGVREIELTEQRSRIDIAKSQAAANARARQQAEADRKILQQAAERGGISPSESKRVRRRFGRAVRGIRERQITISTTLEPLGLTPIFSQDLVFGTLSSRPGRVVGFESEALKQTIPFTPFGLGQIDVRLPRASQALIDLGLSEREPQFSSQLSLQSQDVLQAPPLSRSILGGGLTQTARTSIPLFRGGGIGTTRVTQRSEVPQQLPGINVESPPTFLPVLGDETLQSREPRTSGRGPQFSTPLPPDPTLRGLGAFGIDIPGGQVASLQAQLVPPQIAPEFQVRGGADRQREEPTRLESFVESGSRLAGKILTPILTPQLLPFTEAKQKQEEFLSSTISGFIPQTRAEILTTAATFGVGAAIGGGLRIAGAGLRTLGPRAVKLGSLGVTTVGLGLGGLFAFERGQAFLEAPTEIERGRVLGGTARELGALGLGTIAGSKLTTRGISSFRNIGRQEVPFESITVSEQFASAPRGTTGEQLLSQFRQQRLVTGTGIDKIISVPGEQPFRFGEVFREPSGRSVVVPGIRGVPVFTGAGTGPRGQEFSVFLGGSREPGPFFSIQLSKEFLRGRPQSTFFSLTSGLEPTGQPVAFRTTLKDVGRISSELLGGVRRSGTEGFKRFATPEQQRIISFRAERQDPTKALVSTRFELQGGEIEAIGRGGAVFERITPTRLFSRTPEGISFPIEQVRPTGRVVEPQDLIKRTRGTAIIETPKGVLLTFAPEERAFILPGGGIKPRELISRGTAREVLEETGLQIKGLKFVGDVTGPIKRFGTRRQPSQGRPVRDPFRFVREEFKVFQTKVSDLSTLRPSKEVQKIAFFRPGSTLPITQTTRDILKLGGFKTPRARVRPEGIEKQLGFKFVTQKDLGPGEFTGRQIGELSRVGRVSEGIISPRSLGASRLFGRVSRSSLSGGDVSRGFNFVPPSRPFTPGRTPRRPTISPPFGPPSTPPFGPPSSPPRRPPSRPPSTPPFGPPIRPPSIPPGIPPFLPISPPKSPRERRPKKQKKKVTRRRFVSRLAPSFTAQVVDIRGSLPKEISVGGRKFGVLPGRVRRVPL